MKRNLSHMAGRLEGLRRQGLYRTLRYGEATASRISVGDKTMVNLGSNDYLGISTKYNTGGHSSSSRLVSGNDASYRALEGMLAAHRSDEAALVYPTGYMAVLGAITSLAAPGCTILSDRLNHASIIDACRLAECRTIVYGHNDVDELRAKMAGLSGDIIIITEGIFSMDGDCAPLQEISEIAEGCGAFILLDDAHGDFVAGGGRGTAAQMSAQDGIYATVSSLSKALGSLGGYVSGNAQVAEMQVNGARPFIYTSALPPGIVRDSARRMGMDLEPHRKRLFGNVRRIGAGLEGLGLCEGRQTHIIPVMVGGERRAVKFSQKLESMGVYARAIRYPTVPRRQARIRVSVTAALSDEDIDTVLAGFEAARSLA